MGRRSSSWWRTMRPQQTTIPGRFRKHASPRRGRIATTAMSPKRGPASPRIGTARDDRIRPNPVVPVRVGGRWIVAVAGEGCLVLSIRSGQAARLCKRVKGAAVGAAAETAGLPLKEPRRLRPELAASDSRASTRRGPWRPRKGLRYATKGGVAAQRQRTPGIAQLRANGRRRRGPLSAGRERSIRLCFVRHRSPSPACAIA
jgi:hypothetical protein